MKTFVVLSTMLAAVQASCPNSCSGHGICDSNDQCQCYREGKVLNEEGNYDGADLFNQFTGADCSLMACPRGTSRNLQIRYRNVRVLPRL